MSTNIVVVGAGAWGNAIAELIARSGNANVTILAETTENSSRFPCTTDHKVLNNAEYVFLAIPTQNIRAFAKVMPPNIPIVVGSKGIEIEPEPKLISDVLKEICPANSVVFLSGPSFAADVVSNQPTAVVLASLDVNLALKINNIIRNPYFRCYISDDIIGVQVAGASKNVMAIAVGVAKGKGFGENTQAALITRSLAEMGRLGVAMGGNITTFSGLCGLGDLLLTASSMNSRNTKLGYCLGQGNDLKTALSNLNGISEGLFTVKAINQLIEKYGVYAPITRAVYCMLYEGMSIEEAIKHLIAQNSLQEG